MAHLVTALFAVALILGGALTVTGAALSSASDMAQSWSKMAKRTGDIARTGLSTTTPLITGGGTDIDIALRNTGQTPVKDFSDWDVILRYYATSTNQSLKVLWLTYTTSTTPTHGEWTDTGIYMSASDLQSELYEPNVLNPGEEMKIRLNIVPAIPASTDNLAIIGTPNGVTLSAPFSR